MSKAKDKPSEQTKAAKPKPSSGTVVLPEAEIELCVAKGDIRYYLNYPYLDLREKGKPMLVACTGHYLAAAPVTVKGKVQGGPLPIEAIKAARKAASPGGFVTLVFDGFMVGTRDQMFKRPDHGDNYPDWRKVIPSTDGREPDVALNGSYIAMVQRAIVTNDFRGLQMFCGRDEKNNKQIDATKGVVLRDPSTAAFGVIMPMRY